MKAADAQKLCPELILVQVPTRNGKADISLYRYRHFSARLDCCVLAPLRLHGAQRYVHVFAGRGLWWPAVLVTGAELRERSVLLQHPFSWRTQEPTGREHGIAPRKPERRKGDMLFCSPS